MFFLKLIYPRRNIFHIFFDSLKRTLHDLMNMFNISLFFSLEEPKNNNFKYFNHKFNKQLEIFKIMVFGLFKRKKEADIEHVHKVMQSSFKTVKEDMKNVSSWIYQFKEKHSTHDQNFERLIKEIQNLRKSYEQHLEDHHSGGERSNVHEHVQSF